jgi:hypothetical protein
VINQAALRRSMAARHLFVVLLAAASSVVSARGIGAGAFCSLQQPITSVLPLNQQCPPSAPAGRTLSQTTCPFGCNTDNAEACRLDPISQTRKCTQCIGELMTLNDGAQCGCPAGMYAVAGGQGSTGPKCVSCSKNNYCLGGQYAESSGVPSAPGQIPCSTQSSPGLITLGMGSRSVRACSKLASDGWTKLDLLANSRANVHTVFVPAALDRSQ